MSLPEQATRKQRIDKALLAAGWTPIIPHNTRSSRRLVAFEEYPTAAGPSAIVEAKKLAVVPQNVPHLRTSTKHGATAGRA